MASKKPFIYYNRGPFEIEENKTNLSQPGIYLVLDIKSDYFYIEQSENLKNSFYQEYKLIQTGKHPCNAFQEAYNKHLNSSNLKMIVLEFGPQWIDENTRIENKNKYLELNKTLCFNILDSFKKTNIDSSSSKGTALISLNDKTDSSNKFTMSKSKARAMLTNTKSNFDKVIQDRINNVDEQGNPIRFLPSKIKPQIIYTEIDIIDDRPDSKK